VDAISEIVDSAAMTFTESGIVLQAMDASHVCLCSLELKSEGFVEYVCLRDVVSVGVPIVTMSKIFKCSGSEDNFCIKIEDRKIADRMTLQFSNSKRTSEFQMRLMEIDSEFIDVPDTTCNCNLRMPTTEFQKVVRDLSIVGDSCELRVDDCGVVFKSSGDMGDASFEVIRRDEEVCFEGEGRGMFSTKYLHLFTKATPLCKSLLINLPDGAPLCLEYCMGALGILRYYLAPKLEGEDAGDVS
jgi:proliferating cell nuclear antigen